MRICRDCDFSVPIDGDPDGNLECRRHAPATGFIDDGCLVSAFPPVEPTMWCGDWQYTPKVRITPSNYAQEW